MIYSILSIYLPCGSGEASGTYTYSPVVCSLRLITPAKPYLMFSPTSPVLRELDLLNRSSPDLHDQLCRILHGEEYVQCEKNLEQDNELVWLVDFLDEVRHLIIISRSLLMSVQVLGRLDPSGDASRKCLRELRSICGSRMMFPASYIIQSQDLQINARPFDYGGSGDVFKGTFGGSEICVKRIRVYTQDTSKNATKVGLRCRRFPH